MSLVQLFFLENLQNAFLVLFPDFLSPLATNTVAPMINGMTKHFILHTCEFLYLDFHILISFNLLVYYFPIRRHCYAYKFYLSCF